MSPKRARPKRLRDGWGVWEGCREVGEGRESGQHCWCMRRSRQGTPGCPTRTTCLWERSRTSPLEGLSWNLPGYFFQVCLSWIMKPFGNCVRLSETQSTISLCCWKHQVRSCMYSTQLSAWHMWALNECNVSALLAPQSALSRDSLSTMPWMNW